uniref:Uncharacterized protein n=1 Tax=Physcomitrium patens TaxID=3218 RepID=A0A7I4CT83_PHYPA
MGPVGYEVHEDLSGSHQLAVTSESTGSNFQESFEKFLPRSCVLDDLDLFAQMVRSV